MREPDRGEFEAFARRVSPRLLRSAYLLTGDLHLAQDVVQEALQKVAARWRTLDASPEAYARRIVATTTVDWWRRRQARAREVFGVDAAGRPDPAAEAGHAAVEIRGVLLPALAALPHRQRAVVVLRYLDDLSEAEVAATLCISVGTVKSAGSRGLARLRQLLGDDARLTASTTAIHPSERPPR